MLHNFFKQPTATALATYKREFVKNFADESPASFDYLVNTYLPSGNVKIDLDDKGRLELGYMLIAKKIYTPQAEQTGLLLYGLTADAHYRGTGIVSRKLPFDLAYLSSRSPFLFAQSPNWKIYQAFVLQDLDEYVRFAVPDRPATTPLTNCAPDYAAMAQIYTSCLNLGNFRCFVQYDQSAWTHLVNVNVAANDIFVQVTDAFCFYAPSRHEAYALTFKSAQALAHLLMQLPADSKFMVHKNHAQFVPKIYIQLDSAVMTKAFFAPPDIRSFFCHTAN